MAQSYLIDSSDGIISVSFFKSPDIENFCHVIDEVAKLDQNQFRLWDISCGLDWTAAEMKKVAIHAKSVLRTPASKVAIIAPDDLTFGLFRVHDVFREDAMLEQIVFRSKQDAVAWLKQNQAVSSEK